MGSTFWAGILQAVLIAALPPIASMLVALLFAWFKKTWAEFKVKKEELAGTLEFIAKMAVQAAEQLKLAGMIEDKKDYAMKVATQWLADQKIPMDVGLISDAIEAAVFSELNKPPQTGG